jgi:hypothetical protein
LTGAEVGEGCPDDTGAATGDATGAAATLSGEFTGTLAGGPTGACCGGRTGQDPHTGLFSAVNAEPTANEDGSDGIDVTHQ